ncbi:gamma-glutamylcyclotransferase family protein [Caldovatus aquaticus]|uniref:Putative gamma-glutamylcyclotransferase n=1 Tax=Caldovatus aquaticus TaxID=2865671 RepID=A0ABS7F6N5_9PROT|nr:gamma-glutamylcyclotransferase [Caldovatus aquaticus]
MTRLFLYGTLLDPRRLAALSGEARLARRAVPALLPGHRRVRLRGTPYPTLLPDPEAAVRGLLLPRVGAAALRRLAAYEGPPYRLAPVRVLTPRGPCRARAWLAPRWRADAARGWEPPPAARGCAAGRR